MCHNGGSCVDGINSYSCNCVTGYTGDHCETGKTLKFFISNSMFWPEVISKFGKRYAVLHKPKFHTNALLLIMTVYPFIAFQRH